MTDRLDTMISFVAVCDAQGFAAAARRLGLSPSVVTRQVAALEERLGVRLLHRTTRSVRLTDAGARYLERARRVLGELDEAERATQDERAEPRGRLTVAAPLLFGRMHVAPIVARYLDAYRQVGVDLQLGDGIGHLVEDGLDVAVRIGELADSGLIARRLGHTRRMLVAAPGYLAGQGGPPTEPADLARHRLIAFRALTPGRSWSFRAPGGAPLAVELEARFATNSGEAAIAWAIDGGGIVCALSYQVAAAVRDGALVEVLAGWMPPAAPIHALFPSSRLLSVKVRAFLDMAERAAAQWRFDAVPPTSG